MMEKFVGVWKEVEKKNHDEFVDKRMEFLDATIRDKMKDKFKQPMSMKMFREEEGGEVYVSQLFAGTDILQSMKVQPGEKHEVLTPVGVTMKGITTFENGVIRMEEKDAKGNLAYVTIELVTDDRVKVTNSFAGVTAEILAQRSS